MSKGNWIASIGIGAIVLAQLLTTAFYLGGMSSDIRSMERDIAQIQEDLSAGTVTLR